MRQAAGCKGVFGGGGTGWGVKGGLLRPGWQAQAACILHSTTATASSPLAVPGKGCLPGPGERCLRYGTCFQVGLQEAIDSHASCNAASEDEPCVVTAPPGAVNPTPRPTSHTPTPCVHSACPLPLQRPRGLCQPMHDLLCALRLRHGRRHGPEPGHRPVRLPDPRHRAGAREGSSATSTCLPNPAVHSTVRPPAQPGSCQPAAGWGTGSSWLARTCTALQHALPFPPPAGHGPGGA